MAIFPDDQKTYIHNLQYDISITMPASWKYFALRTLNAVIVLLVVVFLISLLFSHLADEQLEGTVAEEVRGYAQGLPEEMPVEERRQRIEEYRQERIDHYGLEDPFWEKVLRRTWDTFIFDFGDANSMQVPGGEGSAVIEIIMHYLPRTILLFTTSAVIYILLGIAVGLKAAQVAGTRLDKFLSLFGIVTSSMPMWWVGMLAILIFSFGLGWFPASAYPFPVGVEGWEYYSGVLRRMIMPMATIVLVLFGGRAWAVRNMVTSVLQDDYIMAARAKGVPEKKVIYGHTLKTASPPIVTAAILAFLMSIGGAMITEVIFTWPGMGYLLRRAIFEAHDVPVIMGIVFITTFLWVVGYLIADLVYGYLDPRVEVGAEKKV